MSYIIIMVNAHNSIIIIVQLIIMYLLRLNFSLYTHVNSACGFTDQIRN